MLAEAKNAEALARGMQGFVVRRPQSWLLREGWKRAGTVSALEVPSKRR